MEVIETLTVDEATEKLRSLGIRISPETLRDGIEQGQYPFAIHIKGRHGGNVYQVYRRLFDQWIKERSINKEEAC